MSDIPAFSAPRALDSLSDLRSTGATRVAYGKSGEVGSLDGELIVRFYIKPYHMEFLSEQFGFPVFQDRIYVYIVAPGNTKTVWDTLANGIEYETEVDPESGEYHTAWTLLERCPNGDVPDATKYPKAWAAFQKRGEKCDDGWPIEEWGVVTRSMAESLKMLGIPTVEALAALTDSNAASVMGGRKYRDLAKAALDERARNKIVSMEQNRASRLEEKATQQDAEIKQLKEMIANLQMQNVRQTPAPLQAAPQPVAVRQGKVKTSKRTQKILEDAQTPTE
jgi:uncharacterized coiled-coil protein SlyX